MDSKAVEILAQVAQDVQNIQTPIAEAHVGPTFNYVLYFIMMGIAFVLV